MIDPLWSLLVLPPRVFPRELHASGHSARHPTTNCFSEMAGARRMRCGKMPRYGWIGGRRSKCAEQTKHADDGPYHHRNKQAGRGREERPRNGDVRKSHSSLALPRARSRPERSRRLTSRTIDEYGARFLEGKLFKQLQGRVKG